MINQEDGFIVNVRVSLGAHISAITALIILVLAQVVQAGYWQMLMHDAAGTGIADEVVELPFDFLWKYPTGSNVQSSTAVSGGVFSGGKGRRFK